MEFTVEGFNFNFDFKNYPFSIRTDQPCPDARSYRLIKHIVPLKLNTLFAAVPTNPLLLIIFFEKTLPSSLVSPQFLDDYNRLSHAS
ncbi:MAG: hypothetical protein ACI8YQ_002158 [Polaribacter sp.]|jgi:hypothetical protein